MTRDRSAGIGRIRFDRVSVGETAAIIEAFARQRVHPRYICVANFDHLFYAAEDEEFAIACFGADLTIARSSSVVWLSKLTDEPLHERVPGTHLISKVGQLSATSDLRVFLLGTEESSTVRASDALQKMYAGANIVGHYVPSVVDFESPQEQQRIRAVVRSAKPDILLVALELPKQEKWIAKNLLEFNVPLTVSLGKNFEMVSPSVVQRMLQSSPRRVLQNISFFLTLLSGMVWQKILFASPFKLKE